MRNKPPKCGFIVAQKVVVQTGFLVEVLVLQAERLVGGPLSMAVAVVNELSPRVITPFPKEFALAVGHFSRHADLVAVEVVHGMLCVFTLLILCLVRCLKGLLWAMRAGLDKVTQFVITISAVDLWCILWIRKLGLLMGELT